MDNARGESQSAEPEPEYTVVMVSTVSGGPGSDLVTLPLVTDMRVCHNNNK